ncbi:HbrB-like-domain-containing protein [Hysterangium stoloniferum]|nr:HbrB-like-domain-containing protein [Hysterangium stoloniferum]
MRRPVSPAPRRSQDVRPVTPPSSHTAQLRRSSSDVSYRPNRFLAKLKNAGGAASNSATIIAAAANTGLSSALTPPASSSTNPNNSLKANTSQKSPNFYSAQMHRLGTIPAAALAPTMANPASVSSLSLASTLTNGTIASVSSTTDPWHILHVHVLPLFNGEPLRMPLVKKHISSVLSRSPSRAVYTLEQDFTALLARGMITLNVKLTESDDRKLLLRVCDTWAQFWHAILPYVEGVFLPIQTEKPLQSLSRIPKTNKPPSPTLPEEPSPQSIDVRLISLRSFRDSILLPIYPRMHTLLSSLVKDKDPIITNAQSPFPQLQQMLLVLFSISQPSHTVRTSPSPGENAITHLLRAIRLPRAAAPSHGPGGSRHSSFFSGAAPRDRRGRIARKSAHYTTLNLKSPSPPHEQIGDTWSDDTPRNPGLGDERDSEKALLEPLRSPGMDSDGGGNAEPPVGGGWGLGRGHEHRLVEDDDEEPEDLDWDQAQHVVERMVGLRA